MLMTEKMEETKELERIPCNRYPVIFKYQIKALLNSGKKVNAMSQVLTHQLGLKIWEANVEAQKIDDTTWETYEIVVSIFSMSDKNSRKRFFVESIVLAYLKSDVIPGMPFQIMSNTNIDFQARDLRWRSYITADIFPTTSWVELIEKKEFVAAAFDPEHKAFIVHVVALSIDPGNKVYLSKKVQIAYWKVDKAPTKMPSKYTDVTDVFSPKLAAELPKHIGINDYAVKLVNDWQPSYNSIYSLEPIELEIIKAYINNDLANDFIRPSKSPTRVPIVFDKKQDGSLRLCANH